MHEITSLNPRRETIVTVGVQGNIVRLICISSGFGIVIYQKGAFVAAGEIVICGVVVSVASERRFRLKVEAGIRFKIVNVEFCFKVDCSRLGAAHVTYVGIGVCVIGFVFRTVRRFVIRFFVGNGYTSARPTADRVVQRSGSSKLAGKYVGNRIEVVFCGRYARKRNSQRNKHDGYCRN